MLHALAFAAVTVYSAGSSMDVARRNVRLDFFSSRMSCLSTVRTALSDDCPTWTSLATRLDKLSVHLLGISMKQRSCCACTGVGF